MGTEYLNNRILEENIHRYRATKEDPERQEDFLAAQLELTKSFYLLADGILRKHRFYNVDWDEALQEGVMICFEKMHRFDQRLGRAFPFCTQIILNHYKQLWRTAKNHHTLMQKYHTHLTNTVDHSHRSCGVKAVIKYKQVNASNEHQEG